MESMRESLTGQYGLSKKAAKYLLQVHRLMVFEKVWDEYLTGRATAEQVRLRAKLMIEAGLPEFK